MRPKQKTPYYTATYSRVCQSPFPYQKAWAEVCFGYTTAERILNPLVGALCTGMRPKQKTPYYTAAYSRVCQSPFPYQKARTASCFGYAAAERILNPLVG
jgi:hypothetical protein